MNASLLQKTKCDLENIKNTVVEGVFICINCGSKYSTVLKKAVYCRDCRNFRLFRKKTQEGPAYTGHFDDDD